MTKYIIKKTTKYPCHKEGVYYMTRHFARPNEIGECERKDAFLDRNEAHAYMLEIINYDLPYRARGFEFDYEIVEVN